ncbi:unnamed protein product [Nesidiocoris tenuis]|uniref:Uncharacterized protein n=1 Tax=Nesidiocoris tenuis TaxID=355587 RepID=A0A6H5G4L3_9HEMI|nr:unnamed protein product [Nesidiocoris tenuis]
MERIWYPKFWAPYSRKNHSEMKINGPEKKQAVADLVENPNEIQVDLYEKVLLAIGIVNEQQDGRIRLRFQSGRPKSMRRRLGRSSRLRRGPPRRPVTRAYTR